jgi:hypothetical protein
MTNKSPVDPAKAGKLAQQVVDILVNEDSDTRQRAVQAAMILLGETVPKPKDNLTTDEQVSGGDVDLAAFFDREGEMKPADYAQLCAAYHYSLYGPSVFLIAELKAIAADAGVVLPDRVDMTLRKAMHKGKKLFQPAGAGAFKPTATAGVLFAEKWKVKPGKMKKAPVSKGAADTEV